MREERGFSFDGGEWGMDEYRDGAVACAKDGRVRW